MTTVNVPVRPNGSPELRWHASLRTLSTAISDRLFSTIRLALAFGILTALGGCIYLHDMFPARQGEEFPGCYLGEKIFEESTCVMLITQYRCSAFAFSPGGSCTGYNCMGIISASARSCEVMLDCIDRALGIFRRRSLQSHEPGGLRKGQERSAVGWHPCALR